MIHSDILFRRGTVILPVVLYSFGKPTGKKPLGRPRRRWEENIRMGLEEIAVNAGNWVHWAHDRS